MAIEPSIFKAYDVRGKVGSELTQEAAERIGAALAQWLPGAGAIAVGRDMRPDSSELAEALISGVLAQGRNVIDIGLVTSDMIYFAVGSLGLAGGAMITASHNPGEYNGIKLCREEAQPIGEESGLLAIRDLCMSDALPPSDVPGKRTVQDVTDDWITHVLSFITPKTLQPLKIAVDAGNGMAGKIFPELELHVPFEVSQLYFELDGSFPNHIANPLEPKNLVAIQQVIAKEKLDAGVAFDGDGDRAVLLDETGEPLSGTVMTAILAEYFLQQQPGATVLYNAICGKAAVDAIEQAGGKGVRTRVGHSFIKADMRQHGALFAGEHSGHYYFKDNWMADSGLIAAIIGLSILSSSGKTLSALAAPYRQAYSQLTETNFEVDDKQAVLDKLAETYKDYELDWLDGLTVYFDGGWLNVRPSNTEPLLRLNIEAKHVALRDEHLERVRGIIRA